MANSQGIQLIKLNKIRFCSTPQWKNQMIQILNTKYHNDPNQIRLSDISAIDRQMSLRNDQKNHAICSLMPYKFAGGFGICQLNDSPIFLWKFEQ